MMLGSDGFEVFDLGMDGPNEKFIEAIRCGIDIVGKSKLLMTIPTMPEVY
jgi:methanogenic corrinoid protein MtbC1